MNSSQSDKGSFIEDLKTRVVFENLASMVTSCTHSCVKDYQQMYLEPEEENCVKKCYMKSFDFQANLNQELNFLVRNL